MKTNSQTQAVQPALHSPAQKTRPVALHTIFTLSLIGLLSARAEAQQVLEPGDPKRWGLEFNVLWPFVPGVEIYTAKATRSIWSTEQAHGDLSFGILWRPGTLDDENAEKFSELGINLGYRHYFWKGLHAELALYPSFAREQNNKVDGKDYSGFALTTEFYAGYYFSLFKGKSMDLYLMPQAGMGYTAIADLGPESEANSPFPTLNLQLGLKF